MSRLPSCAIRRAATLHRVLSGSCRGELSLTVRFSLDRVPPFLTSIEDPNVGADGKLVGCTNCGGKFVSPAFTRTLRISLSRRRKRSQVSVTLFETVRNSRRTNEGQLRITWARGIRVDTRCSTRGCSSSWFGRTTGCEISFLSFAVVRSSPSSGFDSFFSASHVGPRRALISLLLDKLV